ncbi:unnamed protein product [Closterium sp. Yama58-4]|nr:unnamed protein product [Closterium sp. Yama58-4]
MFIANASRTSRLARQPSPHLGLAAALLEKRIRQAVCGRAMGTRRNRWARDGGSVVPPLRPPLTPPSGDSKRWEGHLMGRERRGEQRRRCAHRVSPLPTVASTTPSHRRVHHAFPPSVASTTPSPPAATPAAAATLYAARRLSLSRSSTLALADVTRLLLADDDGNADDAAAAGACDAREGKAGDVGGGKSAGGAVEGEERRKEGGQWHAQEGEARDGGGGRCKEGEEGQQGEQAEWAGGGTGWQAAPSRTNGVAGGNDGAALAAASGDATSNASMERPAAVEGEAMAAGGAPGSDDWLRVLHDDAHWDDCLLPAFPLPPLALPPLHLPACPSMHAPPLHPVAHSIMGAGQGEGAVGAADLSQIGSCGDLLAAAGGAPALPASPAPGAACCSPDGGAAAAEAVGDRARAAAASVQPGGGGHEMGEGAVGGEQGGGAEVEGPFAAALVTCVHCSSLLQVDMPAAIPAEAICTLFCGHCSALLALPSTALSTITRCSRPLTPPHSARVHVAAAGGGPSGHRGALSSDGPAGALALLAAGSSVHACGEAVAAAVESVERTHRDSSPTAGVSAGLPRTPRRLLPAVLRAPVASVGSGPRGQLAVAGEMRLQEGMGLEPLPPRMHLPAVPHCAAGLHRALPLTPAHLALAAHSPEAAARSDGGVGGAGSAAESKRTQRALRKRKRAATLTAHWRILLAHLSSVCTLQQLVFTLPRCMPRHVHPFIAWHVHPLMAWQGLKQWQGRGPRRWVMAAGRRRAARGESRGVAGQAARQQGEREGWL